MEKYFIKRFQVLIVLMIYLLVVITHIFYLPHVTSVSGLSYNSIFKRKCENVQAVTGLDRVARAIFKVQAKIKAPDVRDIYSAAIPTDLKVENPSNKAITLNFHPCYNSRYSYLSFCRLRI
jgi:hypothetical protein